MLPARISNPKSFRPNVAAAARGPGVGGISTWGANRPVLKATVKALPLTFAFLDMLLVSGERRINAASQKTGMATTYPIRLMAYVVGSFFSPLTILKAITSVAPPFSRSSPSIAPSRMIKPILDIVPPKPLLIRETASKAPSPSANARPKAAMRSTRKGCHFILAVPHIIQTIVMIKAVISMSYIHFERPVPTSPRPPSYFFLLSSPQA